MSVERCGCTAIYDGCEHERGACDNEPGGHRSPYFCAECDPRRIAHISASLHEIADDLKVDSAQHELRYRAGLGAGLGGPSAPTWWCSCRQWRLPARATRSGNNRREAERKHAVHLAALAPSGSS